MGNFYILNYPSKIENSEVFKTKKNLSSLKNENHMVSFENIGIEVQIEYPNQNNKTLSTILFEYISTNQSVLIRTTKERTLNILIDLLKGFDETIESDGSDRTKLKLLTTSGLKKMSQFKLPCFLDEIYHFLSTSPFRLAKTL